MARKIAGSALESCRLLVIVVCLVKTSPGIDASEKGSKVPTRILQESAYKELLKVFEKHFDKLNIRINALENTISSMQFYSIRQFNQISGSLQSTNNDLGTVRKQVSQIEIDGRSQKISLSLIGRDVTELKKGSSDFLGELESSIGYINENMEKQRDLMKAVLEDTLIKNLGETTVQLSKQMEAMVLRPETSQATEPVNCTADISHITEHIDLRFAELKKQTHAQFSKLITSAKTDIRKLACAKSHNEEQHSNRERPQEKLCACKNGPDKLNIPKDALAYSNTAYDSDNRDTNTQKPDDMTTVFSMLENVTGHLNKPENGSDVLGRFENTTKIFNRSDNITNNLSRSNNKAVHIPRDESEQFQDDEDERVMKALFNMTGSVLQAVSYFRKTGRVLEQILSNTDMLVIQQDGLSRRLELIETREQMSEFRENETSNVIPVAQNLEEKHNRHNMFFGSQFARKRCTIPITVLENISTITKNGSQLLEVLTDLAQMSSVSLVKATADLQDEVSRVEALKGQMINTKSSDDKLSPLAKLTNMTQRTFKLIEAVASNTGWSPLIFHNVQHLESLANRSLQIITQNQEILSQVRLLIAPHDYSTKDGVQNENDPTFSNRIPHTLGQVEGLSYSDVNTSSRLQAVLNRKSLDKIERANLQLNKTSPALTFEHKLRIVSSNGSITGREGRLEIYHMILWLPVCGDGWTDKSAVVACRHMGFSSGERLNVPEWTGDSNSTWLGKTSCTGTETRLDACPNDGWTDTCSVLTPAGVNCL